MKFMIVDDSEVIRTKIKHVLDAENFDIVGSAKDGVDALAQFEKYKPDVITMDLTMPNMDGLETGKRIVAIDPDVLKQ